MVTHLDSVGICSACRNAPECTFRRNAKRPGLQCDEFDGYASRLAEAAPVKDSHRGGPGAWCKTGEDDFARYVGLCRDCESSRTCTFARIPRRVMHCEEYL